jgi:hypothetical protein
MSGESNVFRIARRICILLYTPSIVINTPAARREKDF